MKKTTKELAEILYQETMNVSNLYFKSTKEQSLDRQYWAWLHLGFIAALRLDGYTDEQCNEIIDQTQDLIKKSDE